MRYVAFWHKWSVALKGASTTFKNTSASSYCQNLPGETLNHLCSIELLSSLSLLESFGTSAESSACGTSRGSSASCGAAAAAQTAEDSGQQLASGRLCGLLSESAMILEGALVSRGKPLQREGSAGQEGLWVFGAVDLDWAGGSWETSSSGAVAATSSAGSDLRGAACFPRSKLRACCTFLAFSLGASGDSTSCVLTGASRGRTPLAWSLLAVLGEGAADVGKEEGCSSHFGWDWKPAAPTAAPNLARGVIWVWRSCLASTEDCLFTVVGCSAASAVARGFPFLGRGPSVWHCEEFASAFEDCSQNKRQL